MAVTLKLMIPKVRLEKAVSNFDSATGNVGVIAWESVDKTMQALTLISDTAVTTSHFNNWDDDEDVPIGTLLIDQAVAGSPCMWINSLADTWVEMGDVT